LKAPWIIYVSVYCQLLIFLAGCVTPSRQDPPRIWIMFWAILYFMANIAAQYLGRHQLYNHFISSIILPVQAWQILWALSLWQRSATARLTMRLCIPPLVVAIIVLTLTVEDYHTYSTVAEPVYSMVALGCAVFTILSLSAHEEESLLHRAWFWVCAGLILHFGVLAIWTPLAKALLNDLATFRQAAIIRTWINVIALLLITIGILCPRTASSGRSS
jgi:hypothetical protein